MKVLVTGGAGYIGSHTCIELLRSCHEVHVVDSLCNSHAESLERVRRLSNSSLDFTQCDIRDRDALDRVFAMFQPDVVIHFAGLKAVGQSVADPALYHNVNVGGTAVLLGAMERVNCRKIVFSSSATVYGTPQYLPCDEKHPTNPINPYGRTKLMVEELLRDWVEASSDRHAVALRYFNPVGADASGQIGEDPKGIPNNLMPFVGQVAIGQREFLQVFGADYKTSDGTGVRDYIHVVDLALAHVAAIERMKNLKPFEVINIGRGEGVSVLEMVGAFEKVIGKTIPKLIKPRRLGDVATLWADVSLANIKLDFKAKLNSSERCVDTWRWLRLNPNGLRSKYLYRICKSEKSMWQYSNIYLGVQQ